MTLDEAINHSLKQAAKNERDARWLTEQIEKGNRSPLAMKKVERCKRCAGEHKQLAEWLLELKALREEK